MVLKSFASVFLAAATIGMPAVAGDGQLPIGVIEMFTSQGCASCPPADKAMEALAKRNDLIALSYHVDYWNYLGWNDTLATPKNTARQYGYARTMGRSGVYTPQAVLNGRDHIAGGDGGAVVKKLEDMKASGAGLGVPVEASRRGDELDIQIGKGKGKADVLVVYFRRQQTVDVLQGENQGKRISYWNAVTDVQTVGMWDGNDLKLVLPSSAIDGGDSGCAVLLQKSGPKGEPATILGASVVMPGSGG